MLSSTGTERPPQWFDFARAAADTCKYLSEPHQAWTTNIFCFGSAQMGSIYYLSAWEALVLI